MASASLGAAAADSLLRVRRERVHATMLIELLALLVFLSMIFAFVSRDEKGIRPLQARIDELTQKVETQRREIDRLQAINTELTHTNEELAKTVRRLISSHDGTLAANGTVTLTRAHFEEIASGKANIEKVAQAKQIENAELRKRLAMQGKGNAGLPNCEVAPGKVVTIFALSSGGFSVVPAWPGDAAPAVANVAGLTALASGKPLSVASFRALAEPVKAWGESQNPSCAFRAWLRPSHTDLRKFLTQQGLAGQYFYLQARQ